MPKETLARHGQILFKERDVQDSSHILSFAKIKKMSGYAFFILALATKPSLPM